MKLYNFNDHPILSNIKDVISKDSSAIILDHLKSDLNLYIILKLFTEHCLKQKNPKEHFLNHMKSWVDLKKEKDIKQLEDAIKENPDMSKITGMSRMLETYKKSLNKLEDYLKDYSKDLPGTGK